MRRFPCVNQSAHGATRRDRTDVPTISSYGFVAALNMLAIVSGTGGDNVTKQESKKRKGMHSSITTAAAIRHPRRKGVCAIGGVISGI